MHDAQVAWTRFVMGTVAQRLGVTHTLRRVVEPLIQALKHLDIDVQFEAVEALRVIADERAIEPLRQLSEEAEDSDFREAARQALDTME